MTNPATHSARVAFLATDGFEQVELTQPWEFLKAANITTELVSTDNGSISGTHHGDKGDSFNVDHNIDTVSAEDYDALVIPGGLANPDSLRLDERACKLVRDFNDQGKLVATICHGPWLLVEADIVRGRKVTSWPSLRTDLKNAGAHWLDTEVQVDGNLVTSRKPDDLDAFCGAIKDRLAV